MTPQRSYKAVTVGADVNSSLSSQAITLQGSDLKLSARTQLAETRNVSNNLTLLWKRRNASRQCMDGWSCRIENIYDHLRSVEYVPVRNPKALYQSHCSYKADAGKRCRRTQGCDQRTYA